jgi:hypothetical protein
LFSFWNSRRAFTFCFIFRVEKTSLRKNTDLYRWRAGVSDYWDLWLFRRHWAQ